MLLHAAEGGLRLLRGGVYFGAHFAEIDVGCNIATVAPLHVGARNRGDGLPPIRFLRDDYQDAVGNAALQETNSATQTSLLRENRPPQHYRGIHVGRNRVGRNQQSAAPDEQNNCYQQESCEYPLHEAQEWPGWRGH